MVFIGYLVNETDKALFFQDHFWAKADWLPKSQSEVIRYIETHEVKIVASAWICDKKKIQEFQYRSEEEIAPPPDPVDSKGNVGF